MTSKHGVPMRLARPVPDGGPVRSVTAPSHQPAAVVPTDCPECNSAGSARRGICDNCGATVAEPPSAVATVATVATVPTVPTATLLSA